MAHIRYIVNDVEEAVGFYTSQLGFNLKMHTEGSFAMLSLGDVRLVLSVPDSASAGARSMPDGTRQSPGGWNRFAIEVTDIGKAVEKLRNEGAHFRNNIITGIGGKQVILEDPSGNPIELFEPVLVEAQK
ncbi:MAG TPA: VOC family protein [Bacteroidales bacterium]|jgi:catechol 2,3-dioxygenase-like lactoylglutathione lyase family enzyme|nr:VOC family protein [Bacteroidales bacterium]